MRWFRISGHLNQMETIQPQTELSVRAENGSNGFGTGAAKSFTGRNPPIHSQNIALRLTEFFGQCRERFAGRIQARVTIDLPGVTILNYYLPRTGGSGSELYFNVG
jgi:hypothetical protein